MVKFLHCEEMVYIFFNAIENLFLGTNHVSIIIPVRGQKDKFLISIGRELAVVTWDGESDKVSKVEKLYEVDNTPETLDNRINDGKCDSTGRLWAGM